MNTNRTAIYMHEVAAILRRDFLMLRLPAEWLVFRMAGTCESCMYSHRPTKEVAQLLQRAWDHAQLRREFESLYTGLKHLEPGANYDRPLGSSMRRFGRRANDNGGSSSHR